MHGQNVVVIGASGAIGRAFVQALSARDEVGNLFALSRSGAPVSSQKVISRSINYEDENDLVAAADFVASYGPVQKVIVATGILHDAEMTPEKSLRDLNVAQFQKTFAVNTVLPALAAKHFLPLLDRNKRSIFAALSARVGSISDNHLGGWYAYRASKAALNMIIRNAAIEMARKSSEMVVVGLHPGTVDSALSQPFQRNVKPGKLFEPSYAVDQMMSVMDGLGPKDSGRCFAWDRTEIDP